MRLEHLALATFLCVSALACKVSRADTLTLNGAGPNVGGADIYPYSLSINGSATSVSMMCIDFGREVTLGESWQATSIGIPMDTSTISKDFRADAWIFSQLGQKSLWGTTYTAAEIQYAVWDILDPSGVAGNSGLDGASQYLAAAGMLAADNWKLINDGFFSNYELFVPTDDQTGWTDGVPQRYIVDKASVTPEPSSLLLLGTGLMGSAGLMLRRRARA